MSYHSDPSDIRLSDFTYSLPAERIADHPLEQRDASKLLVYKQGEISHLRFRDIGSELTSDMRLVFNDTKVIRARLHFPRQTGAIIETLLLNPHTPHEVNLAMMATGSCVWSCMIGKKKRWKDDEVLTLSVTVNGTPVNISARLQDRAANLVEFSWDVPTITFVDILGHLGELPLPPYIHRKATEEDHRQYQTVYAQHQGAVAAPTAGLHVTPEVLADLDARNIQRSFVTLHVSAGTFLPVKSDEVAEHDMHAEQMILNRDQIEALFPSLGNLVPVGTTSMRLLESMYWVGTLLLEDPDQFPAGKPFLIEQDLPYRKSFADLPTPQESVQAILDYLDRNGLETWVGDTRIFILPGYQFQVCRGLITNFHMPETTLILLVAALVGSDWERIYQTALDSDYRFLSYGDSSLLLPNG
ncbi:S-adenosylmethionine:tRNA ribosyltransferase-isomerase [Pontibacter sp. G13]|uniref:S-adenosylmethionine:tRNA ribosyltransferase-isomerase n=1 Tax=Pontibacter sp. G13 TaxID=3074898 RepID=UPI00288B6E16|nr:S-adenosylmethionine:tRNA ribosyltransferase-isomerase [Pontibacter sp. G13]WNJ15976.1 S-adenosylmethionine:tRNA ribosyltransferase-isomerase [Pontibacter sp. G13]